MNPKKRGYAFDNDPDRLIPPLKKKPDPDQKIGSQSFFSFATTSFVHTVSWQNTFLNNLKICSSRIVSQENNLEEPSRVRGKFMIFSSEF